MIGNVDKWLNELPQENHNEILLHVIKHLIKSKKQEKYEIAIELLLSFSFLKNKIVSFDPQMAIIDYNLVLDRSKEVKSEAHKSLQSIQNAIQQSVHLLEKNREQLASQLFGRLKKGESLLIDKFIDEIDSQTIKPWLRPSNESLSPSQGNLVKVFSGQTADISAIKVIENGQQIITGADNGVVKIWDYSSSNCFRTFSSGNIGRIYNVILAQNIYIIVLSSNDGKTNRLTIWNKENETPLKSVSGTGKEMSSEIILLPDEKHMITMDLSNKTSLVLWEIPSLKPLQRLKHKKNIFSFSTYTKKVEPKTSFKQIFKKRNSPVLENHFRLVTSSGGQRYNAKIRIKVFELKGRKFRFTKHIEPCLKGDKEFILLEKTHRIIIWNGNQIYIKNIDNKRCISIVVNAEKETSIARILPIKNDQEILVFSNGSKVWHYDIQTQDCLNIFKGCDFPEIDVLDERSEKALSFCSGGIIQIWDLKDVGILDSFRGMIRMTIVKWVTSEIFITSGYDRNLEFWEINNPKINLQSYNHKDEISSINILKNGNSFITASEDRTIRIIDLEEKKCIRVLSGHKSQINFIDIYEMGETKLLVSGTGYIKSEPIELKIWDLVKGECISTLELFEYDIRRVEFAKNGQFVIIFDCDLTIKLVDLVQKEIVYSYKYTPKDRFSNSEKFSVKIRFGKYMDVGLEPWIYYSAIDKFLFATYADKTRLLVGYMDGALKILDVNSGRLIKDLEGHTEGITSLEVEFDGMYALTASEDTTIKLWNLKRGDCINTFKCPGEPVRQAIFARWSIDDNEVFKKYILSISGDKTFKLWDFDSGKCIKSIEISTSIKSIAAFKKSQRVLFTSLSGDLAILEIFSGELSTTLSLGREIGKVVINKEETTIIVGEKNGQIHFIDIVEEVSPKLRVM